jgi:site-specific recombinase XerD
MGDVSFSEAGRRYLEAIQERDLSKWTVQSYHNAIRHFERWLGRRGRAEVGIDEVGAEDVRQFLDWLADDVEVETPYGAQQRGMAPSSVAGIRSVLSALWTWAVAEGLAESNVVGQVAPPAVDIDESPRGSLSFNRAVEGYLIDARARQLSPKTVDGYQNSFRHFRNWLASTGRGDADEVEINALSRHDIRDFLAWLGEIEVEPGGVAPGPSHGLSKKSIKNIHCALSALWTWAMSEGLVDTHIVRAVDPPEPREKAIEPLTRDEVQRLLEACQHTKSYKREGKAECRNTRPTAQRDRAIILTLLDTGARSGEIFQSRRHPDRYVRVSDLDQDNLTIAVVGKGDKERILRISPSTLRAIWRYLSQRGEYRPGDALFASSRGGPLQQTSASNLIKSIAENAGIDDVHPHRFRHTFAINFLRNGGKTLELQRLLGHTSLAMVKRYVAIAEVDLERAHRRASPVSNWDL